MRRRYAVRVLVLVIASAACTVRPKVTDSGYTGTWSRGNSQSVSVVAIARQGDRYFFRWSKHSLMPGLDVHCDWDGHCEEMLDGTLAATHDFSTRTDPTTGDLLVECEERRLVPQKMDIHYTDLLVVEPGGKVLRSYTLERAGQKFEGLGRPTRSFEKVADAVAGVTPGTGR